MKSIRVHHLLRLQHRLYPLARALYRSVPFPHSLCDYQFSSEGNSLVLHIHTTDVMWPYAPDWFRLTVKLVHSNFSWLIYRMQCVQCFKHTMFRCHDQSVSVCTILQIHNHLQTTIRNLQAHEIFYLMKIKSPAQSSRNESHLPATDISHSHTRKMLSNGK